MLKREEFKLTKGTGGVAFLLAVIIPQFVGSIVIAIVALMVASSQGIDVGTAMQTDPMLFISLAVIQTMLALVVVVVCRGGKNAVKVCRFSSPKSIKHVVMTIIIFVGIFFGLSITATLFMEFLKIFGYSPTASPFPSIDSFSKYLLAILLVAILPAIFEEMIFRGIILNSLMPYGKWTAIILSGFLFMLIHASPMQTLYQFLMGVIMAIIVIKTGNIFYAMLIHFLNNFMSITFEYFNVFNDTMEFPVFMVAGALILVVVGLVYFLKEKDAIVKTEEKCFEELVFSDNERMNTILLAQEKIKRKSDTAMMIIAYVVGSGVCIASWIVLFVAGI